MKAIIGGNTFHLTRYVLFFIIILLQACASTSGVRLEGNDFEENLPGRWEGHWKYESWSGSEKIKITKIDGNKVHLTGYTKATDPRGRNCDEVSGRFENSILFLTWQYPEGECEDEYVMKRDDSNNLTLDGESLCGGFYVTIGLKKIE
jgi:hypothetical protein